MGKRDNISKGQDIVGSYLSLQAEEVFKRGMKREKRPMLATECHDLRDAERFRMQIIHEIIKKVEDIHNASLGEFRIRELNDEINKLIREKGHWQRQIIALGGPNHFIGQDRDQMEELGGVHAHGSGGYMYFGAAKNLPGVRELFEVEPKGPAKRTRSEMYKAITPDYYGFRDDDDGALMKIEKRAETKIRNRLIKEFKAAMARKGEPVQYAYDIGTEEESSGFTSFVHVPTQEQVQEQLLARKKRELLARYGLTNFQKPKAHDVAAEKALEGSGDEGEEHVVGPSQGKKDEQTKPAAPGPAAPEGEPASKKVKSS